MARLDDGVLAKHGAIFHAGRNAFEIGEQLDGDASPNRFADRLKFAQFAGVARGAEDLDQIRAAAFWISIKRAMPPRARVRSLAICASSKGECSAVAWTSMKLPAPVITTFISTSACESSS